MMSVMKRACNKGVVFLLISVTFRRCLTIKIGRGQRVVQAISAALLVVTSLM